MRPYCSVCGRWLKGRIRRWGGRIMCLRCYRHFTSNCRLAAKPRRKRKSGLLAWLFG